MAKKRVTERLWNAIAPLLPEPTASPKGGRPHRSQVRPQVLV